MPIPKRDILQLLQQANTALATPQSLDILAGRAGWSGYYLLREFRRITGETPGQYIRRVRLDRAAAALRGSDRRVLDIALEAGFNSHEVFIRAFRRQYGCTPSQFRQRTPPPADALASRRYQELVSAISPCLGLLRLAEDSQADDAATQYLPDNKETQQMKTPEISLITLQPQAILYIRGKVGAEQLQQHFAECFGRLFGHGMQQGLPISGNPVARYISLGPGLWTVDCILPLTAESAGTGELQAGFLEGGRTLKATHFGPYEKLSDSYVVIQEYMENAGLDSRGAHWEQYVTDPGQEPDPDRWQTDIYWPVA